MTAARSRTTERQERVLLLLSRRGASIASVAHELGLSERQVKRDLANLNRRLDVSTPLQAAAALGWLSPLDRAA